MTINKYKACLVANGYIQQLGFDYLETFSPKVKPVMILIVLSISITNYWCIKQLNERIF